MAKKENTKKIKILFKLNKNKNTTYENVGVLTSVIHIMKCVALNSYFRQEKGSQIMI